MIGNKTHGNRTETGCCEPFKTSKRKAHAQLHRREVRRLRRKETREWRRDRGV